MPFSEQHTPLRADYYAAIQTDMLDERPDHALACRTLPDRLLYRDVEAELDWSFTSQIAALHVQPNLVDERLVVEPDCYFMTEYSAVPVADAIRGYFDEQGVDTPFLSTITTKAALMERYFGPRVNDSGKTARQEVRRLRAAAAGARHACVVEQTVFSGETANIAAEMLLAAGVGRVSLIYGRWYDQASVKDISINRVTSSHAAFMHSVGARAARSTL